MGEMAPGPKRGLRLLGAAVVTGAMVLALPATVALAGQAKGQTRTVAEHPSTEDWHPAHGAPHPGQGNPHPPNGGPHPPDGEPHPPDGEPHPPDGEPHPPDGEPHPPDGEPHPPQGNFTCRASVLRLEESPLVDDLELGASNPDNDPCVDDSFEALDFGEPGEPIIAEVLTSSTDNREDGATSEATVTNLTLNLGETTVQVELATSQAEVTCEGGQPVFSGTSTVAGLTIDGEEIEVGGEPNQVVVDELLGITLTLNQEIEEEEDSLTRRAVFLQTPVGTVIVAESIADVNDNPCA